MDKQLGLLEAYEAWLEENARELGMPVELAKTLVEMEVHSGVCDGCSSKPTCPAHSYLIARDVPVDGMPANEA